MPFDVESARKSGYSDDEIVQHLSKTREFDYQSALKSGYSSPDIIDYLSKTPPPGRAPATPTPEPAQPKSVREFLLKSIPESAVGLAKGVAGAVTRPVETGKTLLSIPIGAAEKGFEALGFPQKPSGAEAIFDAFTNMLKERYGSMEAVKETAYRDPIGFLLDVSTVGAPAAGAIKATGAAPRVAEIAGRTAEAISPLEAPITVAKALRRPAEEALGFTTGTGRAAVQEAMKGSPEFVKAMRGVTGEEEILGVAQTALQTIKNERGAEYQGKLSEISKLKQSLDISPIRNKLDETLKVFNVKPGKEPGTLDFSRSTIDKSGQADVERIVEMVKDWGSKPGDRTPIMLDTLKRRLDDFYSENKNSRVIVSAVKDSVKGVLTKNVPEYQSMTANYARVSEDINEIQKALSLGTRAGADTALKKLLSSMRNNQEFRRSMLNKLDEATAGDLSAQVAGAAMKSPVPAHLGIIGATGVLTYLVKGLSVAEPSIAASLAMASPRIVGEVLSGISRMIQAMPPIPVAELGKYGVQAQRLLEMQQEQRPQGAQ